MKRFLLTTLTLVLVATTALAFDRPSQGTLIESNERDGNKPLPLVKTNVEAYVSSISTRVTVQHEFHNPRGRTLDAVFMFPLSAGAAVDQMEMKIGSRVVRGEVLKREAARKAFRKAVKEGKRAALLDQERPNIFTQSVGNIRPGEKVVIEISYVELTKYKDGAYQFVFPMTINEKYDPYSGTNIRTRLPNAVPKKRSGKDISITVDVDSGVPTQTITSKLHQISVNRFSAKKSRATLEQTKEIANQDFILRIGVLGQEIQSSARTYSERGQGFFSLVLQPPDELAIEDLTSKEIVFVMDTSGSMNGAPLQKSKEVIQNSLRELNPEDRFNIVTFAGRTDTLFDELLPASQLNVELAREFIEKGAGGGGTEMMEAIRTALRGSDSGSHLRIVCFLTDGEISNEDEILAEIKSNPHARVFSMGIGDSVNRFLLERMAEVGRGDSEIVTTEEESEGVAERFYQRIRRPLLTDIKIDWKGLEVSEVFPRRIPDVFTSKPVVLIGLANKPSKQTIKITGKVAGLPYERDIEVDFQDERKGASIASLWASAQVKNLRIRKLDASYELEEELTDEIANLGLKYQLVTDYTSFVAIEGKNLSPQGDPKLAETLDAEFQQPQTATNQGPRILAVDLVSNSSSGSDIGSMDENDSGGGGGGGKESPVTGPGLGSGNGVDRQKQSAERRVLRFRKPKRVSSHAVNVESRNVRIHADSEMGKLLAPKLGSRLVSSILGNSSDFKLFDLRVRKPAFNVIKDDKHTPVTISFRSNSKGTLITKSITSEDRLVAKTALIAMRNAKFHAPELDGEPIPVEGEVTFSFANSRYTKVQLKRLTLEFTEKQENKILMKAKLHPWIYYYANRLQLPGMMMRSIEGDNIRVIVTADVVGRESEEELSKAGLKNIHLQANEFLGEISRPDLTKLIKLSNVKHIRPLVQ